MAAVFIGLFIGMAEKVDEGGDVWIMQLKWGKKLGVPDIWLEGCKPIPLFFPYSRCTGFDEILKDWDFGQV